MQLDRIIIPFAVIDWLNDGVISHPVVSYFQYQEDINMSFVRRSFGEGAKSIIVAPLTETSSLVVNPEFDRIDAVDNCLLERIFEKGNELEDVERCLFIENIFQCERRFDTLPTNKVVDRRCRQASYIICPTYACNLRCSYCYQQRHSGLDRVTMLSNVLEQILSVVAKRISAVRKLEDLSVDLQLFGGEPFLPKNAAVITRCLAFAREHGILFSATTNGLGLGPFIRELAVSRNFVGTIGVTLDGMRETHDSLRLTPAGGPSFDQIVDNVDTLVRLGVHCTISTNATSSNLSQIPLLLNFFRDKGWWEHPKVSLQLGRVDDRLFEGTSADVLMEAELLERVIQMRRKFEFPKNFRLAFLHATARLAASLGLIGEEDCRRVPSKKYCWANCDEEEVYYVDSSLQTFRCPVSVGRSTFSLGRFDDAHSALGKEWFENHFDSDPRCRKCGIAPYCAGGCHLSRSVDVHKSCHEEQKNFSYFVEKILAPEMRRMIAVGERQILGGVV